MRRFPLRTGIVFAFAIIAWVFALSAPKACELTLLAPDLPPYGFFQDRQKVGVAVDATRELNARIGCSTTVESLPRLRAQALVQGQPDALLAPLARIPDREDQFEWVGTLVRERIRIFSIQPAISVELSDLKAGASVAVLRNSGIERLAQRLKLPNTVVAPDSAAMVRMLHAGRVDAIILPYSLAVYSARQENLDPDRLQFGETLTEFDVSIAMSKGSDPALAARLKSAFATLQSDN